VPEVTVEIEDLADFNESINWAIYGPSGHGKTSLAGGAPNATFISTEKGVVAAKRTGSKAKLIRTPTWKHVVAAKKKCDAELGPEDWTIWDSGTKMQVLMLRWILQEINAGNPSRDLDIPAIQDHQKWQNYFKRFVDSIIDARYNSIWIFTEMYREDQDGETIVLPAITGKDYEICNYIRAQMDISCYYGITDKTPDGQPIRRALFQPYPPFVAPKDRYNVLGKYQDVADGEYGAMGEFIEMVTDSVA
jgi:hypothetical protein